MEPMEGPGRQTGVKRLPLVGIVCATLAATLMGCTGSSQPSSEDPRQSSNHLADPTTATQSTPTGPAAASDHGSLTNREFSVAVAIARRELSKNPPWSVSSVTATVRRGTVVHGNMGPHRHCLSGTLVKIEFLGKFPNITTTGNPGQKDYPVNGVLVLADPVSGQPCMLSVVASAKAPHPVGTELFRSIHG
jgi:hypothetical protein